MRITKGQLGDLVRSQREHRKLTQDALAKTVPGVNRSNIAHLEQGLRVPRPEVLEAICIAIDLPRAHWQEFLEADIQIRLDFEEELSELTGQTITLLGHDDTSYRIANEAINRLFCVAQTGAQAHDLFNSVLVFYGIPPTTRQFFDHYLGSQAVASIGAFRDAVRSFQKDAVRLFSTLAEAYRRLSRSGDLNGALRPLQVREVSSYSERSDWRTPTEIPEGRLAYLGYISAARVKRESEEREQLRLFLLKLAADFRKSNPSAAVSSVAERTRRRMDSLLRKFGSHFEHGLFSPLFGPDADEVESEAERVAPKSDSDLSLMEQTQREAMENLSHYLASDFIDVYVATSMRSDADFVSVNAFAKHLFENERVKPLKLRYFNPTQSWIDDRIAKGLIEALMLRRASVTIYMAQKSDTFGKDSEASVALGQGKPVIVFVPRLSFPDGANDSEQLFRKERHELLGMLSDADREGVDDETDHVGLFAKVLQNQLMSLDDAALAEIARTHWADFDLMEEQLRIPAERRENYRVWLRACIDGSAPSAALSGLRVEFVGMLISNSITFERRAMMFRDIHPLALQVILASGILNGILVVRTVTQCASVLSRLIRNDLELDLTRDDHNYRLVERTTGSTIRVISRHRLLLNAFAIYYNEVRRDV